MIEYYRALILIYIAFAIIALLGPLSDILHNKTIRRCTKNNDFAIDDVWELVDKNGNYRITEIDYIPHWSTVFVIPFIIAALPSMLFKKSYKAFYPILSIWAILLSAPLFIYICDNLSIYVNWG